MPLQRAWVVLLAACPVAAFGGAKQLLGVWRFCFPEKISPDNIKDSENVMRTADLSLGSSPCSCCFVFLLPWPTQNTAALNATTVHPPVG